MFILLLPIWVFGQTIITRHLWQADSGSIIGGTDEISAAVHNSGKLAIAVEFNAYDECHTRI